MIVTITQWAWSIAITFLIFARDPRAAVVRVGFMGPPPATATSSLGSWKEVTLNGAEDVDDSTHFARRREPGKECRSHWAWVSVNAGGRTWFVHSPAEPCGERLPFYRFSVIADDPWR